MDLRLKLDMTPNESIGLTAYSSDKIAVIGISAKMPSASTHNEFFDRILQGKDCVNGFPDSRKSDIEAYLRAFGGSTGIEYLPGAYLDDIDKFDHRFFGISAKEAALMDPHHRLFLEQAWRALEDAAYGGDALRGTRTGVYVADIDDSGYKHYVAQVEPESVILSTAGNINAMIASRIAYMMDFKGPSMLVDTTCSSSLVAIHLACEGIRNGSCDMALAGGVKLSLLPIKGDLELGIESNKGKTKSFDDGADGTVFGEGVMAIFLKRLSAAIRDGDSIYSVIAGSAINQDGNSIGITAPNVLAQEEVIVHAWKNAKVSPKNIRFIEAHGTGTSLGDPIEIKGIDAAFRQFTDMKQFCAVGSVKSLVGHLGNAAGIAGFIKSAMAIRDKVIPPTIHFDRPNRKIGFDDTAVYVCDSKKEWKSDDAARQCGISSFGLSGTNCHLVLEEAPHRETRIQSNKVPHIFSISAKSEGSLFELVKAYTSYLQRRASELTLADICYTVTTGRGHFAYRIAIVANDTYSLLSKLEQINKNGLKGLEEEMNYTGTVAANARAESGKKHGDSALQTLINSRAMQCMNSISTADQSTRQLLLSELCRLYTEGADISWKTLFSDSSYNRVHLPGYAFERIRCWIDYIELPQRNVNTSQLHPLIHKQLAASVEQDIYSATFSVESQWVLSEHNIKGQYFPPGTAYIEMVRSVCCSQYGFKEVELSDILFITPLLAEEGEEYEVQIVMKRMNGNYDFLVASRKCRQGNDDWNIHATGKAKAIDDKHYRRVDLDVIRNRCQPVHESNYSADQITQETLSQIHVGSRWNDIGCEFSIGEKEVLANLQFPEKFAGDMEEYGLHPALLDRAVNAVTQHTGNGLYLPLAYRSFKVYASLPPHIVCHIRQLETGPSKNKETISFDITITDQSGFVLCEIERYSIKRVSGKTELQPRTQLHSNLIHGISWVPEDSSENKTNEEATITDSNILFFCNNGGNYEALIQEMTARGFAITTVSYGDAYQHNGKSYVIRPQEEDYRAIYNMVGDSVRRIVYATMMNHSESEQSLEPSIHIDMLGGVRSIVKVWSENKLKEPISLGIISNYAFEVTGEECDIYPIHAAISGLGRCVIEEHPHLHSYSVDMDAETPTAMIVDEILAPSERYAVAFRKGKRYMERLVPVEVIHESPVDIHESGVYLITGGLGDLGLRAAKHIAERQKTNLALISRSALDMNSTDISVQAKVALIEKIKEGGSTVTVCQADVSDFATMKDIIERLRHKHGKINGVIHAAGIAGDSFLFRMSDLKFHSILNPKVQGTWILDSLTSDDNLDFFVLYSSIATLYGAPGQAAYTAANTYMDSYAAYRSKQGRPTLSINWAPWSEIGMAHRYKVLDNGVFKAIHPEIAMESLFKQLGSGLSRIIVGELNTKNARFAHVHDRIPQYNVESRREHAVRAAQSPNGNAESEVNMTGKVDGKYDQTEVVLAHQWSIILGEKEINIYESLFNMGGDSIIASQLLRMIDKAFPGMIDITDIFTYPSIHELAVYINGILHSDKEPNESANKEINPSLDSLMDGIQSGGLSIDDGLQLLRIMGGEK